MLLKWNVEGFDEPVQLVCDKAGRLRLCKMGVRVWVQEKKSGFVDMQRLSDNDLESRETFKNLDNSRILKESSISCYLQEILFACDVNRIFLW